MAQSHERALEIADGIADVCTQLSRLDATIRRHLGINTHHSIDWGAAETPAYLQEEADGRLSSRQFTRQEVSNAVGSLDAVRALLDAGHLGNLNKLSRTN